MLSALLEGFGSVYSPKDEPDHGHDRCRPAVRQPTGQPCSWLWELLEEPVVEHGRESGQDVLLEMLGSLLVDTDCLNVLEGGAHFVCLQ